MIIFQDLAKIIINLGVILVSFGSVLWVLAKLPFLGKLPGDVLFKKANFTVYLPIGTMILLSLIFSLLLTAIHLFKK